MRELKKRISLKFLHSVFLVSFFLLSPSLWAAPSITSVSPNSGTTAGGNVVTITGSGFTGATNVAFGTASAAFIVNNDTSITATAPASVPSAVNITVTAGAEISPIVRSDIYTYTGDWFAYVAETGASSVRPINVRTNIAGSAILVGSLPFAIAIQPNTSQAVTANFSSNNVSVINLVTNTVTATVPAGSGATNVAITPNGLFAYVANNTSNTVSVIDLTTLLLVAIIPVGPNPVGIAITADGQKVYVCNQGNDTVSVISTASNIVLQVISGFAGPREVAITPDSLKAYVTNLNDSTVKVIDTTNDTIIGSSIPVGSIPYDIDIASNGSFAYVVSNGTNSIYVIDIATNIVAAIFSGITDPIELAITPDNALAYVTSSSTNSVIVVNLTNGSIVTTISGFPSSFGIAISPDQSPVASFTTTGTNPVNFDASSSISPVGSIQSYFWNFGDGTTLTTASPIVTHTYTKPDSYTVTLTVTNTAGTSTTIAFTGQTMGNNGSSFAMLSQTITIPAAPAPHKFKGKLKKHWHKKELHLKLRAIWKQVSGIQFYEIFAYKKQIATVTADSELVFKKPLDPKHYYLSHLKGYKKFLSKKYKIRSVDAFGIKSTFVPLDF